FSFCFILLYQRFRHEKIRIAHINDMLSNQSNEYNFSKIICWYFNIDDKENINYVTAWVLGLSVGNINRNTADRYVIKQVVQGIVYRFEGLAGIRFLNKESFIERLYEHFRPSYYRILYN